MGFFIPLDQIASEVSQVLGYKRMSLAVLVRVVLDNRISPYYLLSSQEVSCILTKLLCLG